MTTYYFIYFTLFIFALDRSIFAFQIPSKIRPTKKKWLTTVPFISYIIFFFGSVIEFSSINDTTPNSIISLIGLIFLGIGILLRYQTATAFKRKNQPWSSHTEATHLSLIIKDGPYKYTRHPYYLSVIIELAGIALFLNSFISLFFILFLQSILIQLRIKNEENELLKKFGNEYLSYMKNVGNFPRRQQ